MEHNSSDIQGMLEKIFISNGGVGTSAVCLKMQQNSNFAGFFLALFVVVRLLYVTYTLFSEKSNIRRVDKLFLSD